MPSWRASGTTRCRARASPPSYDGRACGGRSCWSRSRAAPSRKRWIPTFVVADPVAAAPATEAPTPAPIRAPVDWTTAGVVVDRSSDFTFDGGRIDLEVRRVGDRVVELARSRYIVPVVMAWQLGSFVNLSPLTPASGVTVLQPAPSPDGDGPMTVLAFERIVDVHANFHRAITHPRPVR